MYVQFEKALIFEGKEASARLRHYDYEQLHEHVIKLIEYPTTGITAVQWKKGQVIGWHIIPFKEAPHKGSELRAFGTLPKKKPPQDDDWKGARVW